MVGQLRETHVPKVLVQYLDIPMDDLQGNEFIVGVTNLGDEEERCVTPVNYLPHTNQSSETSVEGILHQPSCLFTRSQLSARELAAHNALTLVLYDVTHLVLPC